MITRWAIRHGVSEQALAELVGILTGGTECQTPASAPGSEAAIQTALRLNASRKGVRLWRNNVGATYTADGSFIRYGLCNESKRMNESIKSADLVGVRPVLITPAHVGTTIGQFVAREVKRPDWKYHGRGRERAQLAFLVMIALLGGDAMFANKGDEI